MALPAPATNPVLGELNPVSKGTVCAPSPTMWAQLPPLKSQHCGIQLMELQPSQTKHLGAVGQPWHCTVVTYAPPFPIDLPTGPSQSWRDATGQEVPHTACHFPAAHLSLVATRSWRQQQQLGAAGTRCKPL